MSTLTDRGSERQSGPAGNTRGEESPAERDARFERDALAHLNRLYAAGLRLTGSRTEAEDLVQETYLRAYRLFPRLTCDADLAAFLFRVQNNVWRNSYRSARPTGAVALPDFSDGQHWRSSEVRALEDMADDAITAALRALAPELRAVLYFADVEGYSYQEIADITDTPRGMVMTRLFQARRRLRTLLTNQALRSACA
ncbi:sigma-70 family RNA polymerase sigma factor [Yinghuangia sp. YIM S09857]|uniref:sigma-70 family RNA polymerase sigma factor n=1 Tax=Yinghuangia sp. YIM S09857 TaxID=3436929 RepID=UPI003F53BCE6